MRLHLVDATYELFRAHFAPRPPVLGRDGIPLSGVSGLVEQLLYLLREEGATHVGAATDRVIESFRNELYPGYKSSAGMPPELLAQFPIAEAAVDAEEHFEPPDPGPVLGGDPLLTMAWFAAVGMPIFFFILLVAWRDAPTVLVEAAGVVFALGVAVLVWRMPNHRRDDSDDDHGAVV